MIFSLKNIKFCYRKKKPDTSGGDGTIVGIEVDDLDIPSEGVTAIIGPSGSGKTTLLSILAKFLPPEIETDGRFHFDGKDTSSADYEAGQVSFVFQSPMLLGAGMTAVNVLQGSAASKSKGNAASADKEAYKVLQNLGLIGTEKKLLAARARHLSGGEAQRASVSRALLTDPKVVLCDEPTSALDVHNATRVLNELRSWAKRKKRAVVWVTHNLEQAANYAENYVFVSRGRIYRPDRDLHEKLKNGDKETRLQALNEISTSLHGHDDPVTLPKGNGQTLPKVNAFGYSLWIANALSSDGLATDNNPVGQTGALAPRGVRKFLEKLHIQETGERGFLNRLALWICSYSRYGLALVLTILLAQVFAALFFGKVAETYATQRLQDPAIARIVFEHVIDDDRIKTSGEAQLLYADSTLKDLENKLKALVSKTGGDPARVHFFGRRSVDGSKLRFPDSKNCAGRWYSYDTVALNWDDPLYLQTTLADHSRLKLQSPQAVVSYAKKHEVFGLKPKTERSVLSVDERLFEAFMNKCEQAPGSPIMAEWAVGPEGELNPHPVEIVAAMREVPPIYPNVGQLIVFEQDFRYVVGGQTGNTDTNFRIATAYFPIDAFDSARKVVKEAGYLIRDDSAAAVKVIENISNGATKAPHWITSANILVCFVIILLTIHSILEVNKRVFALFIAHGFRTRDLLTVLSAHLLPAMLMAGFAVLLILSALWSTRLLSILPNDIGDIEKMRNMAFLKAIGIIGGVAALSLVAVTIYWTSNTRKNLKTFIQD